MSFEEFLDEVWKNTSLPNTARLQLSLSLSDRTKKRLLKMEPATVAGVFEEAVDRVNHGAVESIDTLIRSALDR